jgi:leucyl/phenylalanyl-tRNA--protein transferase
MPQATDDDPVAVTTDVDVPTLIKAYEKGVFPWPIEGVPLIPWFCPPHRGVLFFSELHIPRSLKKVIRQAPFTLTLDRAFKQVMEACMTVHSPSWITPALLKAYAGLHLAGHAHSVEAWDGTRLVGGIYGVDAGGAFACESMFYYEDYASKLALWHLIEHLKARGLEWIDIQMVTPHMEALGAREISRAEFLKLLKKTQGLGLKLF